MIRVCYSTRQHGRRDACSVLGLNTVDSDVLLAWQVDARRVLEDLRHEPVPKVVDVPRDAPPPRD